MSEYIGLKLDQLSLGTLNTFLKLQISSGRPGLTFSSLTGSSGDRIMYGPVVTDTIAALAIASTLPELAQKQTTLDEAVIVKHSLSLYHQLRLAEPTGFRAARPAMIHEAAHNPNPTPFTQAALITEAYLGRDDHDAGIIISDILAVGTRAYAQLVDITTRPQAERSA